MKAMFQQRFDVIAVAFGCAYALASCPASAAFQATHLPIDCRSPALRSKQQQQHSRPLKVSFGGQSSAESAVPAISVSDDAAATAALDWSFLDGVYLITCPNADEGGERLTRTKKALESIGISSAAVGDAPALAVKEFDTDDENRIRGCYTSHISVLRDIVNEHGGKKRKNARANALEQLFSSALGRNKMTFTGTDVTTEEGNGKKFLILEDNLAINGMKNMKQSVIDAIDKYTSSGDYWDMIHLSYIPYVPDLVATKLSKLRKTAGEDGKLSSTPAEYDDQIVQLSCGVGSALGTTAYIINLPAIEQLLAQHDAQGFTAPIPDVMAREFPESRFAVQPTLLVRAPTTKSLVNPQLDDLRSFLFRPAVVSFAQQLLVATELSTNKLLLVVVAVLLSLTFLSGSLTWHAVESILETGRVDGPIFLPILSSIFTIFNLGIILQGALLAPKPTKEPEEEE